MNDKKLEDKIVDFIDKDLQDIAEKERMMRDCHHLVKKCDEKISKELDNKTAYRRGILPAKKHNYIVEQHNQLYSIFEKYPDVFEQCQRDYSEIKNKIESELIQDAQKIDSFLRRAYDELEQGKFYLNKKRAERHLETIERYIPLNNPEIRTIGTNSTLTNEEKLRAYLGECQKKEEEIKDTYGLWYSIVKHWKIK